MKYHIVSIPLWSREKGDYTARVTVPEELTHSALYNHTEAGKRVLFAIGGTAENGFCDNWDIYADEKGTLYSIARYGTTCESTFFGDVRHVRRLINQGHFHDTLTAYGRRLMEGA